MVDDLSLPEMKKLLERQALAITLMREQLRENERLLIYQYLKVPHTFDGWSHEVQREILRHIQGDKFVPFLRRVGYTRHGPRTFKYLHEDKDLPNITVADGLDVFAALTPEVINAAWLEVAMKKKARADKARLTRTGRKRSRDVLG